MLGYKAHASDKEVGKVRDFLFDDHLWTVRYVVVETGKWLHEKEVLISPSKLGEPDWGKMTIPLMCASSEVEKAPGIYDDLPVSMREKIDLSRYEIWSPSWPLFGTAVTGVPISPVHSGTKTEKEDDPIVGDPHLRSVHEVAGYKVVTSEGESARVEDFIVETGAWVIRYFVIELYPQYTEKRVLVSPEWVEDINWGEASVHLDLDRQTLIESPDFDPEAPINKVYEAKVYDFYGRPKYWQ